MQLTKVLLLLLISIMSISAAQSAECSRKDLMLCFKEGMTDSIEVRYFLETPAPEETRLESNLSGLKSDEALTRLERLLKEHAPTHSDEIASFIKKTKADVMKHKMRKPKKTEDQYLCI